MEESVQCASKSKCMLLDHTGLNDAVNISGSWSSCVLTCLNEVCLQPRQSVESVKNLNSVHGLVHSLAVIKPKISFRVEGRGICFTILFCVECQNTLSEAC